MITLAIRTDKPEAELYLFKESEKLTEIIWAAHRELSDTLHKKIQELLRSTGHSYEQIDRVVVYAGPGSFTGLRIGHSVANALAYSLAIPIVAATDEQWLEDGLSARIEKFQPVAPLYGAEAHITLPKK
jgi:tRNA threonylcarbamoyladenosine biosynthesis protein TsaB